jgi:hypothetical protein
VRYEFTVAVRLSEAAVAAFPELLVSDCPGSGTTLYGPVLDRAQLDGLVARFSDLGLDLVTMHRLPD